MWYATFDHPWGQMSSGVVIRGMKNDFVQSTIKKGQGWFSISVWLLLPALLLLWRNVNLFLVCVIKLHPVRFDPVVQTCDKDRQPSWAHSQPQTEAIQARFQLAADCFLASEFKMSASSCHCLLPDLIKILGWRDFGWDRTPFRLLNTLLRLTSTPGRGTVQQHFWHF